MIKTWNEKKTLVLFLLILCFRALFSWKIPLIDDEAYHWSWTQDLMLSYYDHPGMISWLETLSLSIFGPTYWGVRFPSFVCFALTTFMSYKLAKDLFNKTVALIAGFIFLWSPLWGFGGYVASPEPPFMLCFVTACWVFWQGVRQDSQKWSVTKTWLYLGVLMGLGLNSKFIIALLAPGFGLYLLITREHRKDLLTRWPWLGFLIATLLCVPIFLWNIQYDWPGFRYQFYERHSTTEFSAARWFEWLSAQILFYTPFVYFLILAAFIKAATNLKQTNWRYLFCLTAPTIFIFYPQPLFAEYKPHWSGGAHLLLVMGAAALWQQGLIVAKKTWIKPQSKRIMIGVLAFFIPLNLFIYTPFLGPWMPQVYRKISSTPQNWNLRWDLSNEFYGWEELGTELLRTSREFHAETGQKPFLAALRYEINAQTWWGAKQKVYSLSHTKSHYTIMQKARQELEALVGQNALVVTTEKYPANPMEWAHFDRCQPREFKTYRGTELSRIFTIWKCWNYKGLQ